MGLSAETEHYHGLVDMGRYVEYYLISCAVLKNVVVTHR